MLKQKTNWKNYILETYPLDMSLQEYLNQNERKTYFDVVLEQHGNKILEVGFGSGLGLIYLFAAKKEVVGVDLNRGVVQLLKERTRQFGIDIPVILADAFRLPLKSKSFDIILHEGLLEHFDLKERVVMLKEHLRVAKKIVVDVPTVKSFTYGIPSYDERLLSEEEWIMEWHKNFEIEIVFRRTFVSIGAVLTN